MMSTVIGGAMLPHAPQFFTMPETEDKKVVEHCRAHLASYKKPRAVRFVASLPRSHYGKVIRAELLAQVTS